MLEQFESKQDRTEWGKSWNLKKRGQCHRLVLTDLTYFHLGIEIMICSHVQLVSWSVSNEHFHCILGFLMVAEACDESGPGCNSLES